jgi:hypothetical protein
VTRVAIWAAASATISRTLPPLRVTWATGGPRLLSAARGPVCAFAYQMAVGLLNDVAEMNADAKNNASLGRQTGDALGDAVLNLDRHRSVDDAAELDQNPSQCT